MSQRVTNPIELRITLAIAFFDHSIGWMALDFWGEVMESLFSIMQSGRAKLHFSRSLLLVGFWKRGR